MARGRGAARLGRPPAAPPPDEVETALAGPGAEIHVARVHGEAVGLCEFRMHGALWSELAYFGLIPAFQGLGIGPRLLGAALRGHWHAHRPRCVWLHTDTWDDPRALPLYKRFGFRVFATLDMPDTTTEEGYRDAIRERLPPEMLEQGEQGD